jgi:hypothetical protein
MSLNELLEQDRLEQKASSRREIRDLLSVADRSLGDAAIEQLSLDGRFNCAYDAALLLATIPLRCAGYRTKGAGHHQAIFDVLHEIMGEEMVPFAQYLEKCRKVRNLSTYSRSGIVARSEVVELIARTEELREAVNHWLRANHPQYC